jgi:hypothetical protein
MISNIKTGTKYYSLTCFKDNRDAYQFQQRAVDTIHIKQGSLISSTIIGIG